MKKLLTVLLSILMIVIMTGCTKDNGTDDRLARIKKAGYITIATEGVWEPWTFHDPSTGELTGFDVEVGKLIAQKLGVEARFSETEWDSILIGVSTGKFDIACNGVGYTEERAKSFSFTDPYVFTDVVLIVRGDSDGINSFEDLNGKVTANSIGSTYAALAEKYGATVQNVDTLDQTIQLLIDGRIDATINSLDSFEAYVGEREDVDIKYVAIAPGDAVVIPVNNDQDSASLRDAINQALNELRSSGELARLSIQFFGSDKTVQK